MLSLCSAYIQAIAIRARKVQVSPELAKGLRVSGITTLSGRPGLVNSSVWVCM
jgi:hypothetical protein